MFKTRQEPHVMQAVLLHDLKRTLWYTFYGIPYARLIFHLRFCTLMELSLEG